MKFDKNMADNLGIVRTIIRGFDLSLNPKTWTVYTTKNGRTLTTFEGALQHANELIYIPKSTEPQSTLVRIDHIDNNLNFSILRNNGLFDFVNYKFDKMWNDVEVWKLR